MLRKVRSYYILVLEKIKKAIRKPHRTKIVCDRRTKVENLQKEDKK